MYTVQYTKLTKLMGGAIGTDSTAVAVPLLSEVRQNDVLPYHLSVKTLIDVHDFIIVNLACFGPYIMVNRFSNNNPTECS